MFILNIHHMERRQFIKGSAIVGATVASSSIIVSQSGLFETKTNRKVFQILNADRTMVGTLPVLRTFAGDHLDHVSPYVFFDEFGPVYTPAGAQPLRVDAHPHAGIIPTTYFVAGSGHHKDSLNYDFQIGKGDFMMFSSGRGAIHMEESGKENFEKGGDYNGFQIWLNMPSKYKFSAPSTIVHKDDKMGVIVHEKYTAKVVLGELYGAKSDIELLSPAFYYHITLKADCRLDIPTNPLDNAFVYVVKGSLEIEGHRQLNANQIALYQRGDDLINLYAKDGADILVLGGKPLNEPVYSYGPFVMNTEEEIRLCIANYRSGKMGDPNLVN